MNYDDDDDDDGHACDEHGGEDELPVGPIKLAKHPWGP